MTMNPLLAEAATHTKTLRMVNITLEGSTVNFENSDGQELLRFCIFSTCSLKKLPASTDSKRQLNTSAASPIAWDTP
jgi:hypothetical protein